jgi:toxin-antitoxin system PIN domain toxin
LIHLLDVNVLIALLDGEHVHCRRARDWFMALDGNGWATCPLTENGTMRIMGHRTYPGSPGTPATIAMFLGDLTRKPGHVFWADTISLIDPSIVARDRLLTSVQLTDTYLLALARANGGKLATFDRRLATAAIPDGAKSLHVIR